MAYHRNRAIVTTPLPDGYVVLHSTDTDWAQTLTPIAGIVWEFCDGKHDLNQIVDEVSSLITERTRAELHVEIKSLLNDFTKFDLVQEG